VKHTESSLKVDGSCVIEDVIKEGVKHIKGVESSVVTEKEINKDIQNGVKS